MTPAPPKDAPAAPARAVEVQRDGDHWVATWPGVAVLRTTLAGEVVAFDVHPDLAPAQREKLRRGHVRALVRHLRGELTLHAATVAAGGAAVACLAESGGGKSTAAALLCRAPGVALVSDDTTPIAWTNGALVALPVEDDEHWLVADAAALVTGAPAGARKGPVDAPRRAADATPLVALVFLRFDDALDGPRLAALRGADAFRALALSLFRVPDDSPARLLGDVDQIERIARRVPMYDLARPRDLARADATTACLRELLGVSADFPPISR